MVLLFSIDLLLLRREQAGAGDVFKYASGKMRASAPPFSSPRLLGSVYIEILVSSPDECWGSFLTFHDLRCPCDLSTKDLPN